MVIRVIHSFSQIKNKTDLFLELVDNLYGKMKIVILVLNEIGQGTGTECMYM